jgi:outer membrane protein TolC
MFYKKNWGWSLILLLSFGPGPLFGQEQPGNTLSLSLEECILKTMRNNLRLAVEVLSPEIADAGVSLAGEKFMPSLIFSYNKQDTNSASFSFLDASQTVSTLQNDYSAQLGQLLPTGGNLTLSVNGYKTDTNRSFQSINPRYGNTLRLNFSQPLLKDFGPRIARREIIIARNNQEISELNFDQALEEVLFNVQSAYWLLSHSLQNLAVRQQSLKLANELLEKNRAEIEAGTLAPIEILTAQADVATRKADILGAEAQVRNSEDLLKTIMNLSAEHGQAESIRVIPTDSPTVSAEEHSLEEALLTAMKKRPDLQASRVDLDNKELDVSYARNQVFPDLRFQASYWSPGVSGDQLIYEGGNALTGKVIAVIPGGSSKALQDAIHFKYKNWAAGLTLSLPLSDIFSRALHTQAKLNLDKATLQLSEQEQQIFLEIRTAVRSVQTNFERIEAYRAARELAEKKLEAEQEKFSVGLSTNYFILQYQRDLADAQIMELRAVVDYNISLAFLNRAQGTGREELNISVDDIVRSRQETSENGRSR